MIKSLNFHNYKNYLSCPKKFKFQYIDKVKIEKFFNEEEIKINIQNDVLRKVFLDFYQKKLFLLKSKCRFEIQYLIRKYVDESNFEKKHDLVKLCFDYVENIIFLIKKYHLLSVEYFNLLSISINRYGFDLIGEIPLKLINSSGGVEIYDIQCVEKESLLDKNKLLYYGLLNQLKYGECPHKLGFILIRQRKVKFVRFQQKNFDEILNNVKFISEIVQFNNFEACMGFRCKWCQYTSKCTEGLNYLNDESDNGDFFVENLN